MQESKKEKYPKFVIYAALALPSIILLVNDNSEYKFLETSIPAFPFVLLSIFAIYLFYEKFMSKDLIPKKTANVGPKNPLRNEPKYNHEELNMGTGEFGNPNDKYNNPPRY